MHLKLKVKVWNNFATLKKKLVAQKCAATPWLRTTAMSCQSINRRTIVIEEKSIEKVNNRREQTLNARHTMKDKLLP